MSVRELACAYDLVAFDKKKWYVGKSLDDAVATYASKTGWSRPWSSSRTRRSWASCGAWSSRWGQ